MFNKIWKDPVWSKVIAVIIVFIGTTAIAKFKSYTLQINFVEAFNELIFIDVPILYIFYSVLIYWIVRFFLRKIGRPSILEKQKAELLKFKQVRVEEAELLIKWELYFDGESPVVHSLTVFCTKHGIPPLRYIEESVYNDHIICPAQEECTKQQKTISYSQIANYIRRYHDFCFMS